MYSIGETEHVGSLMDTRMLLWRKIPRIILANQCPSLHPNTVARKKIPGPRAKVSL